MNRWFTGSGEEVSFDKLLQRVRHHVSDKGTVYVGTDSFLTKDCCTFSTAIVLHGGNNQVGGYYFFTKNKFGNNSFNTLIVRVTEEVNLSVQMALKIRQLCPTAKLELHIDASPADGGNATSQFSDMLIGFAKGAGFNVKVKPDAFAAACIADKHSK
tara:strand:+ start:10748 stop:11218 length:471 start_codon:yes stop_codon:yes gene_type:complete